MFARGIVAVNWGDGGATMKMISGHEPGHELTPTDTWHTKNSATDAH